VWPLALAALGVVFGDIGTSPLYALKECLTGERGVIAMHDNVLGVLSLIFWSLTMVVTVKYLTFIMRADNRGEGGILALLALVPEKIARGKHGRIGLVTGLVVAGAALLYGDGIITPAISVLSAMEGLEVARHGIPTWLIVSLTCIVLIGLFWVQHRGTATVGRLFGPVMVTWFVTISVLGLIHVVHAPGVLAAVNPIHAVHFFATHGWHGFALLGSVVLAVTGGEALYADMGHFGIKPIRRAWWLMVLPALMLSYFGQGALLLTHTAGSIDNPFYAQVPTGVLTYLLVALSTMATVIASQALISGAFSLTHQAVQLGLFPRVTVTHTSHETEGQIYVPEINTMLAIGCLVLVIAFRESTKLAAAYGLAVTGTMGITSIIFYVVARNTWGWPRWKALPLMILFLSFDLPFFVANAMKFLDGGYVPVMVGLGVFIAMMIWRLGKTLLGEHIAETIPTLATFFEEIDHSLIRLAPGTAVFMASSADRVPPALLHLVRRVHARPHKILLVTVIIEHQPYVPFEERLVIEDLTHGMKQVVARYGYMQKANVPDLVKLALERLDEKVPMSEITYYLGHETFIATNHGKMRALPEKIFAFLSRNSKSATSYFSIPPNQVVELGSQIDL